MGPGVRIQRSARPATTCSRRRCPRWSWARSCWASRATRRCAGIMRARTKEAWRRRWRTWASTGPRRGGRSDDPRRRRAPPPERAGATIVRTDPIGGRRDGRFPGRAEAHLMAGASWAMGELSDGAPTRLTLELATLAPSWRLPPVAAPRRLCRPWSGRGAAEVARYAPRCSPSRSTPTAPPRPRWSRGPAVALARRGARRPGAGGGLPDGKDVAGMSLVAYGLPDPGQRGRP